MTWLVVVILGVGLFLGVKLGKAQARALRAWRDLQATRKSIHGLVVRVATEWRTAAKLGAIVGGVVVAAAWWVSAHA